MTVSRGGTLPPIAPRHFKHAQEAFDFAVIEAHAAIAI
jgi:hypothetical protein